MSLLAPRVSLRAARTAHAIVAARRMPAGCAGGDEHGARGPRGWDLLCSHGMWARGWRGCRSAPAARPHGEGFGHGMAEERRPRGEQCRSQLRAPVAPAGVWLRSVGEALLGTVSSSAQAGSDDANHATAAAACTRGAERLPGSSLTGRACLIVVHAVVGSSPIAHPSPKYRRAKMYRTGAGRTPTGDSSRTLGRQQRGRFSLFRLCAVSRRPTSPASLRRHALGGCSRRW